MLNTKLTTIITLTRATPTTMMTTQCKHPFTSRTSARENHVSAHGLSESEVNELLARRTFSGTVITQCTREFFRECEATMMRTLPSCLRPTR